MIAVSLRTVCLLQFPGLPRLQVQQPLVALLMPDGEIAVVHQGEEDILAIVAGTRPGQALTHRHGIKDRVHLLTKLPRRRIECDLTEVILLILVVGGVFLLKTGQII